MTQPLHDKLLACPTADFVCLGRVNGMTERDANGSYVLISARQKEGQPYRARLSLGGVETLIAELQGAAELTRNTAIVDQLAEALEPFARGPDKTSLAKLYAHLNREHYHKARQALATYRERGQ